MAKVHPAVVEEGQRLPAENMEGLWEGRYASIRDHEAHLVRNGTRVLKFFLNLSHEEQRDRFVARIDEPEKNWKFSAGDVKERSHWPAYQAAYQEAIQATATPEAPWYVIPADDKKNMRLIVSAIIKAEMETFEMSYPKVSDEERAEMQEFRKSLLAEPPLEG